MCYLLGGAQVEVSGRVIVAYLGQPCHVDAQKAPVLDFIR